MAFSLVIVIFGKSYRSFRAIKLLFKKCKALSCRKAMYEQAARAAVSLVSLPFLVHSCWPLCLRAIHWINSDIELASGL